MSFDDLDEEVRSMRAKIDSAIDEFTAALVDAALTHAKSLGGPSARAAAMVSGKTSRTILIDAIEEYAWICAYRAEQKEAAKRGRS